MDECKAGWKKRNENLAASVASAVSIAIIFGFWTAFWGGLAFLSTSMFYAAIGWVYSPLAAVGGSLVGKVYLTAITALGSALGFVTAPFHCWMWEHYTPWLCRSIGRGTPCPDTNWGPIGHESWTELLEAAIKEAKH